ncbi:hypothetical protein [Pinibacter soli]|uniref:Uncharacterized protein n=1 Tax=Pinibacter soli TaxID=3044211 RepID=A0ABT6R842_9BACT|nr:hypothetical protein [Pinibacter soli]MDI3318631.1 hypothetical protein [Pinibacter soli]
MMQGVSAGVMVFCEERIGKVLEEDRNNDGYKLYHSICPVWDNSSRRKNGFLFSKIQLPKYLAVAEANTDNF